jgi:hypothetical protein
MKGKDKQKNRNRERSRNKEPQPFHPVDLSRVEFHRHALALVPHPGDRGPGVALMVEDQRLRQVTRLCSCPVSKARTCQHLLELSRIWKSLNHGNGATFLWEAFKKSLWHRLAEILAEGSHCTRESVHVLFSSAPPGSPEENHQTPSGDGRIIKVVSPNGEDLLYCLSSGADGIRFLERCGKTLENSPSHRTAAFQSLALITITDSERRMMEMGFQTRGQALERSFWHLLAYHGFRELGPEGFSLRPEVEEATGAFTIICCDMEGNPRFRLFIPRNTVRTLLAGVRPYLTNQHDLEIHPLPLKSIFKVSLDTQMDLELRPLIQLIQESGEARFF